MNHGDLVRALRASITLREKVFVFRIDAGSDTARLAEVVALLRAHGARPLVVCDPGNATDPFGVLGPALAFAKGLAAHQERGVALSATSALSVHVLPKEAAEHLARQSPPSAPWEVPGIVPLIEPVLILHLMTLAYVPVLAPPILDQTGAIADVSGDTIAALLARAVEAVALILPRALPATTPAGPSGVGPRVLTMSGDHADNLLSDLLSSTPSNPGTANPAVIAMGPQASPTPGLFRSPT